MADIVEYTDLGFPTALRWLMNARSAVSIKGYCQTGFVMSADVGQGRVSINAGYPQYLTYIYIYIYIIPFD